jgi:hypothetical protein
MANGNAVQVSGTMSTRPTLPVFQTVTPAAISTALKRLHDTNRQSVTIIYNAGIAYHATFLNNADRHRKWQMCATYTRSLDDIANAFLGKG